MNATDPVIRPATPEDLDAVAAIFAHYVTTSVVTFEVTPPTVAYWRRIRDELDRRGLPFLVCECAVCECAVCGPAGQVAGYAYATPWRPKPAYRHTVESTIYLAPDHTGRGIGRLLLGALLQSCTSTGVEQVIAVVADSGNPASASLHRACGFTEAGRLRNVGRKHGRLIDTLLFQRELAA
ncbi:MAG TPA: GNAT family N-acetyltransferase [Streptosporangiaceae bacterium]